MASELPFSFRMLHDIRYALRTLRQNPGFALVAIVSLALGIGANSAIFSLADALLLRPLPVSRPGELVTVNAYRKGENIGGMALPVGASYPDYLDFRRRSQSFERMTACRYTTFGFAASKNSQPELKFGLLVSGNFFDVLGVEPTLGRGFRPEEDRVPGRDAVAVISHDLWLDQFGGRRDMVGRTAYLGGIAFTIVGVAPESFTGVDQYTRPMVYVPMMMGPRLLPGSAGGFLENRADRSLRIEGRLKPGVSLSAANAELGVITGQLARAYPKDDRNWNMKIETQLQNRFHQSPPDAILIGFMLFLAAVVLLIACANVANLMLSRARARSKEIAVRLAIGAGRFQLVRQLFVESLVVALLGGAGGLLLAQIGADAFSNLRVPSDVPIVLDAKLDPRVLLFTLAASIASALLFGLAPAWRASRTDLVPALKSGPGVPERRRRLLGRNGLVVAQVAGSLVLVVAASQLYRGTELLFSSPMGFRTDHILMASFDPSLVRYSAAQTADFYDRLVRQARELPGAKSAALARMLPMSSGADRDAVVPEGYQFPRGADTVSVLVNTVTDGYFETIGTPVLRGRGFLPTDTGTAPPVVVVNKLFAEKYFPGQDALGKRVRLGGPQGPWAQIVGIAAPSKYLFVAEPPMAFLYRPYAQNPVFEMALLVESRGPSAGLAAPLRDLVRKLDADLPIFAVRTMAEYFDQRATQVMTLLDHVFGAMALLGLALAIVGLYGLMTYSVSRRTREIGIRMAIGAGHRQLVRMVVRQGMLLAGIGAALGVGLSLLLSRALTAALRVPSFDLVLLALAAIALLGVAALGAFLPARRAASVDPLTVLRQE